jgi:CRP-like cAMP-binding protein
VFPADAILYTLGDDPVDLCVVLEGEVNIILPSAEGGTKVYVRHCKNNFTGEFSLLTPHGATVEARTVVPSTLLRIARTQLWCLPSSSASRNGLADSASRTIRRPHTTAKSKPRWRFGER